MMYAAGASQASILKQGSICLDIVSEAVKIDNETFDVRFLGYQASSEVIQSLIGFMAAGLAAGVRTLFQSKDINILS